MFKDLIQLYSIGKDLGLNKQDINKTLIIQKRRNIILPLLVLLIIAVIVLFVWDFIALSIMSNYSSNSTYGHGIRYSSISIKDFKKKNEIKYWLRKKIQAGLH